MTKMVTTLVAASLAAGLIGIAVAAEPLGEVTVQASRVMKTTVGRTSSGIPIVDSTLSYGVSYADLNLTKHADVVTLQTRVKDAAKKACTQLGHLFPVTQFQQTDAECTKAAADKALAKVDELAGAAK